jgi:hypothetical protein
MTIYGQCAHCNGVLTAGHKCPDIVSRFYGPPEQEKELRELRMWHWRQCLQASRTLCSKLGNQSSKTRWRNAWKLHMGAVQLLNDFVSGTAEEDCAKTSKR